MNREQIEKDRLDSEISVSYEGYFYEDLTAIFIVATTDKELQASVKLFHVKHNPFTPIGIEFNAISDSLNAGELIKMVSDLGVPGTTQESYQEKILRQTFFAIQIIKEKMVHEINEPFLILSTLVKEDAQAEPINRYDKLF